jgi:MSHA biogenesis protein MshJ
MSSPLVERIKTLFAEADIHFRIRTARERLMISAMILAVLGFTLDGLLIRPLDAERRRVAADATLRGDQLRALEAQLAAVRDPIVDEPERQRRDEIRQLEHQIAEIDAGIRSAVSRLVPPESAVEILEELLVGDERLELVSLTSDPPRRLGPEQTQGTSTLYQHGLTLEIQGDFASTLEYLRRIEKSDWQLLWDHLDYRVESYPEAHVTIELHTLSEKEEWVGV